MKWEEAGSAEVFYRQNRTRFANRILGGRESDAEEQSMLNGANQNLDAYVGR
jgi:hypothetical protein